MIIMLVFKYCHFRSFPVLRFSHQPKPRRFKRGKNEKSHYYPGAVRIGQCHDPQRGGSGSSSGEEKDEPERRIDGVCPHSDRPLLFNPGIPLQLPENGRLGGCPSTDLA